MEEMNKTEMREPTEEEILNQEAWQAEFDEACTAIEDGREEVIRLAKEGASYKEMITAVDKFYAAIDHAQWMRGG